MEITKEIDLVCVVKEMIIDDVFWLSGSFGTSFIHFHAPYYYFGSLREDVPHRVILVKMAKIKVCKSS